MSKEVFKNACCIKPGNTIGQMLFNFNLITGGGGVVSLF